MRLPWRVRSVICTFATGSFSAISGLVMCSTPPSMCNCTWRACASAVEVGGLHSGGRIAWGATNRYQNQGNRPRHRHGLSFDIVGAGHHPGRG